MIKSKPLVCDVCGGTLQKAPFSSTFLKNVWLCTQDKRHVFVANTHVGTAVELVPVASTVMIAAVVGATLIDRAIDLVDLA